MDILLIALALIALFVNLFFEKLATPKKFRNNKFSIRNSEVHQFKKFIKENLGKEYLSLLPDHDYMVLDDKPLTIENYLNLDQISLSDIGIPDCTD